MVRHGDADHNSGMPWHDFGGASWAISTWTMFGRLPALVALAMIAWCAVRRGWSWRAAVLVTCAFVAGLSAGTALFPSIVGAYFAGWQTFPGAQVDDPHLMPGLGIQANVSRRYVFGLDGIFGGEGAAGAAHFMMVVSP